ncbi:MAG TPA: transcription antitermination factor NusB [Rhodocyclaceae bacterium]|mgnify:FL=1|nr:transcription antitermination factor NusB [Rhodocyclaceae bacterium]
MTGGRTPRRRAREFALQGLYAWLLNGKSPDEILSDLAENPLFARVNAELCTRLLHGGVREAEALRGRFAPYLDRPLERLSPVEHALLLLATYELAHHPEMPARAIINEAIEVAKVYGGTEGHRYVNGVLDRLAGDLRPEERAPQTR